MEKRERLEKTLAGEPTDRAPVALWRPFPGDDQRVNDHVQAVNEFQFAYDWDMCVVVPPWSFAGVDYDLQDEWRGAADGETLPLRRPVKRSLDWTELRVPDPTRGAFGRMGEVARRMAESMQLPGTPVVLGILSPLAQAERLAGRELLIRHLRTRPDRLRTGLNTLTDATLRFLDSLRSVNLAGVYLMVEHADPLALSEAEYEAFGLPGDAAVLAELPKLMWLKMAYLRGDTPMLKLAEGLNADVLGWDDMQGETDLATARGQWGGAFIGGLDAEKHLRGGTPVGIREASRAAQSAMASRRLIVGCGAPGLITTPASHWRAARLSVEKQL
ncbi:MAG: uroporphyrinogen decarboxylase family protein [Anaerolineae bacterium]|jgi:uroporphyrinogen decarboxylase|nr:uroporphyrinogen decarboxylase family protein [Anaerolineae bacterium]